MIRELTVAASIAAAALSFAAPAAADDESGRYPTDVPGMNYHAALGAPCENTALFTFGRGRGGQAMKCSWIPNQWPPARCAGDGRTVLGGQRRRTDTRRPPDAVPRRVGLAARRADR